MEKRGSMVARDSRPRKAYRDAAVDKSSGDHQASRDNGGHRKSGPRGDERPPSAGCVSAERGMHGIVLGRAFKSNGIFFFFGIPFIVLWGRALW